MFAMDQNKTQLERIPTAEDAGVGVSATGWFTWEAGSLYRAF